MGNLSSTAKVDEEVKAREAEERRREEERQRVERTRQQEEIRKKQTAEYKKAKEEKEKEVEEESRKNLEVTKKEVAGHNERKTAGEKRLEELTDELKNINEQQIKNLKKSGMDKVTKENEDLRKKKEEVIKEKELLAFELNRMKEEKEENVRDLIREKDKMKEEEKEKDKRHQEEILELTKKMEEVKVEGEQELVKLAQEHLEVQKTIKGKHEQLNQLRMADSQALMAAKDADENHDTFRQNCKRILDLFQTFRNNFDTQESDLLSTIEDMKERIEIGMAPELWNTRQALQTLSAALIGLSFDGCADPKNFKETVESVRKMVADLLTAISSVVTEIERYERRFEAEKSKQGTATPNGFVDLFPPTSSAESSSQTPTLDQIKIETLYNKIKELIKQLNNKTSEFNIRASNTFDKVLSAQSAPTSIRLQEKERLERIQAGPSTSTSGSAPAPCIQAPASEEAEESEEEVAVSGEESEEEEKEKFDE